MQHGLIRREPGRNVAAQNRVHDPVGSREQEKRVRHVLKPRRVDPGRMHNDISKGGQNDDYQQTRDYGADAPKDTAPLVGIAWPIRLLHRDLSI